MTFDVGGDELAKAFGAEARLAVFRLHRAGVERPRIVKLVTQDFGCSLRPVRKVLVGLDLLQAEERSLDATVVEPLREVFKGSHGGTDRYLMDLRRFWSAFERGLEHDAFARHWAEISGSVELMRAIGSFALHSHDLAFWATRPQDKEWPISGGHARREEGGKVSVRFEADGSGDLQYVRRHLPEDPLWDSMERCRNAIARDLASRLQLFDQVRELIERPVKRGGLGTRVAPDLDMAIPEARLGPAYVFGIVDRVLSARIGLRGLRPEIAWPASETGIAYVGSHLAARVGPDPATQERISTWFDRAPWKLRVIGGLTGSTAEHYKGALTAVDQLRTQADRVLASNRPPSGTRCDLCKSWLVDDVGADDFKTLRADIAKRCGPVRLGNEITRIKSVFKYAADNRLIEHPVTFGSEFRKPNKSVM